MVKLNILGTRGIPARHGGFETFAEKLAIYLKTNGWSVTVYCQEDGAGDIWVDKWQDIELVKIPTKVSGAFGSIIFDYRATKHAASQEGINLVLGYNTAVFNMFYRIKGKIHITNMDGMEWKRDKWNFYEKSWLYVNEWLAGLFADHLVADHPEIKKHLMSRVSESKITMIPYGADEINYAQSSVLEEMGLLKFGYFLVVARPEPENSILEIVQGYTEYKREQKLVILGKYEPSKNKYHKEVMNTANNDVIFMGAIYEKDTLSELRYYAKAYIHGHKVGGTNPSLVEALGVGRPVIAHNNKFNRWVAGKSAIYFYDAGELSRALDGLAGDNEIEEKMSHASKERFDNEFRWQKVLKQYETLLERFAY